MSTVMVSFGELLAYPLRSGVTVPKDRRGSGIRMINMGEVFRYPRLGDTAMALVDIDYTDTDRFLVQPGDLLFARRSLTLEGAGKCAIVHAVPVATTWESSIIRARMNREKGNPYFYFYLFRSPLGRRLMGSIVEQVAVAGVRSSDLRNLLVPNPSLREQDAVVDVLGALDDKIAANERIAATALHLGKTLYRHAAESSRESATLGDLIDLKYGKSLPAARRENGPVPVFGSGGVSGSHNDSLVPGPGVIVGRKGTVGAVYWSQEDFFPIDTTFYVSLKSPDFSMEYIYFALQELGLEQMNSDSAVPGLNRANALALRIETPAPARIASFTQRVRQLFDLKNRHERENGSLADLRDTLLPQLMSGKLRIREAEKIVEDAV